MIDFGGGHTAEFYSWDPDLTLNPQYQRLAHLLPVDRAGLIERHERADVPGEWHDGGIPFEHPELGDIFGSRATWKVESWEPLTLSPSILCECGVHGYIRNGLWVPA